MGGIQPNDIILALRNKLHFRSATATTPTTTKCDSLIAELKCGMFLLLCPAMCLLATTDPQHSSAKRQQQRTHTLKTTLTQAAHLHAT